MWAKNATKKSFDIFYEILSIPNDANHLDDIELNVKWWRKNFAERGFITQSFNSQITIIACRENFPEGP